MVNIQNQYGVYFTKNDFTVRIPVNPQEISISHNADNETYNVLGLGQVVVPREPELRKVEWNSFFPSSAADPYVLTAWNFQPAPFYLSLLDGYQKAKEPFSFTIDRPAGVGIPALRDSFSVILDDFKITEKGGETGDYYYSIKLIEYKPYAPQTIVVDTASKGKQGKATQSPSRPVETPKLVAGGRARANGKWWYSSYGDKPFGRANNVEGNIVRVVDTKRAKPYLFSRGNTTTGTGWMSADELTPI